MNSYAWDTAILFLQICGKNARYSMQGSLNTTLSQTGTNTQSTKDVQCNVYDMASNEREWTTETSSNPNNPCVARGGNYSDNYYKTNYRYNVDTSSSYGGTGFRPLLFVGLNP